MLQAATCKAGNLQHWVLHCHFTAPFRLVRSVAAPCVCSGRWSCLMKTTYVNYCSNCKAIAGMTASLATELKL